LEIEQASFGADAYTREMFAEIAGSKTGAFLVALEGPVVVGYLVTDVAASTAYVTSIAVRPDRRRRGLGAALLRWAIQWAAGQRAGRMALHVSAANAPAIALYARFGFRAVATVPRYYADGSAALFMVRPVWD